MRLIEPEYLLADPAAGTTLAHHAVLVDGERIVAVGPAAALAHRATDTLELPGTLLMPGLVNAHQHGRGISQLQLGFPDDRLEPWIARRLKRGAPDPYALTLLAAAEMLRNGVSCAVHANYSYGSGDYEAEARASLDAYLDAGLRVTFCVGAMDRGMLVYPGHDETAFLGGLPTAVRTRATGSRAQPYAGGAAATIALMRRLQADYGAHPLVTLAYGPAGPQWVSDPLMKALAADARDHGLGLHLHLLESPTQAAMCAKLYPGGSVVRHLAGLGALGRHTTLAHCVHLDTPDIEEIARSGATVAHNPGSNLRLSNGFAPTPELLRAGVPVAIGTDNCAMTDDEDLLGELRLADLLARRAPSVERGRRRAARLLDMVTGAGARAAFVDDGLGRIEPGRWADLTALDLGRITSPCLDADTSLLEAVAQRARGGDVVMTMVAGSPRFRDGALTGLDLPAIRRAAALSAGRSRPADAEDAAEAAEALAEALRALYRPS